MWHGQKININKVAKMDFISRRAEVIDWELIAWFGLLATRLARHSVYAVSSSADEPCGFSYIAFSCKGRRVNILGFCRPYVCSDYWVVSLSLESSHRPAETRECGCVSVVLHHHWSLNFRQTVTKIILFWFFFFNSSIFDFVWFGFVCLFVLVFIFFNVWKKILSLPAIQSSWQTRFGQPTIICQLMLQKFLGL